MKRVLVITYYWPPSGGSGVQRWLKFAKYLPQFGWQPVIYTPENPEANSEDKVLLNDILPGTEVIKKRIIEPYGIYKALLGKKKKSPIKANIISNGEDKSLMHKFSMFIRGNIFIPDPRCLWIRPSVKFLKRYLKENHIDAIVSTGPPHSMHLIAKQLSRETGIKWIADFRDPWTEIFFFKHLGLSKWADRRHRRLEQSVLDNADTIVVVSQKMQEDFAKRTSTPVEVITNGFDPDDFTKESSTEAEKAKGGLCHSKEKFTIVHTGLLVDNGNPDKLWHVLGEMAKKDSAFAGNLEIRVMGQVDQSIVNDINQCGIAKNFVNMGYVPHNVATMWQQAADLLLLPLRKEPEAAAILTGKFFEYVAAGSPILAFGPLESNLATELEKSGCGTICEWEDCDAIKRAVEESYKRFLKMKNGDLSGVQDRQMECRRAAQLKYSRKTLTGQLSGLLNKLTDNR